MAKRLTGGECIVDSVFHVIWYYFMYLHVFHMFSCMFFIAPTLSYAGLLLTLGLSVSSNLICFRLPMHLFESSGRGFLPKRIEPESDTGQSAHMCKPYSYSPQGRFSPCDASTCSVLRGHVQCQLNPSAINPDQNRARVCASNGAHASDSRTSMAALSHAASRG